jgi:hypothetical protein
MISPAFSLSSCCPIRVGTLARVGHIGCVPIAWETAWDFRFLLQPETPEMSRQIELYMKVAADYDRMALLVNDQRLRNMFIGFAQQWREAAVKAEPVDMVDYSS